MLVCVNSLCAAEMASEQHALRADEMAYEWTGPVLFCDLRVTARKLGDLRFARDTKL